jgi:hypothetical protein
MKPATGQQQPPPQQQQQPPPPPPPGGRPLSTRDNWYRDDWFNKQEQWQVHDTHRDSYRYRNEADDRFITRLRSPSPERPRWTDRDMMAYQNRSLDRGMRVGFYDDMAVPHHLPDFALAGGRLPPPPLPLLPLPPDLMLPPMRPATSALTDTTSMSRRPLVSAMAGEPQPSLVAALRERIGLPLLSGRRLPKPPPERNAALSMPQPTTPLPYNQKPRNRKLPKIPNPLAVAGLTANMGGGATPGNTLTTSLFGFAKKLTSATSPSSHHPPTTFGRQRQEVTMKNSQSFTGSAFTGSAAVANGGMGHRHHHHQQQQQQQQQHQQGRLSRKLPAVPRIVGRRQLPDRSGYHSRSLEGSVPTNKLDTVLEVGRGVRKLPVPLVKSGCNGSQGRDSPIFKNYSLLRF